MIKYQLDNGLTVILKPVNNVVSISAGLWVKTGSRCEQPDQYGYAHFIEHMLFKGTKKYSAKDIAQSIDRVGGQHNAATNRSYTCYYINVVRDFYELALELLSEMYHNSLFREEDIEKERDVILEELRMYEDSPDEHIHDVFTEIMFGDHPLSHEIIGTEETLKNITRDSLVEFFEREYTPDNTVLVLTGNFDSETAAEFISTHFSIKQSKKVNFCQNKPIERTVFRRHIKRDLEQVHFCLGFDGISKHDDSRWALYLLSTILGGSMSSRLFQSIREKEGLCYSVYSFHSSYSDGGFFGIYCGTSPSKFDYALDLTVKEITDVVNNNVTAVELNDAKTFMKGNLALSLESIEAQMGLIARDEINFKKHFTYEDIVSYIDSVTLEDISALTENLFTGNQASLVTIGNIENIRNDKIIIPKVDKIN